MSGLPLLGICPEQDGLQTRTQKSSLRDADRETLRLEQLEFTGLPGSLLLNLVVAAVIGLVGGVQYWGNFSPIRLADNPRWGISVLEVLWTSLPWPGAALKCIRSEQSQVSE